MIMISYTHMPLSLFISLFFTDNIILQSLCSFLKDYVNSSGYIGYTNKTYCSANKYIYIINKKYI